MKKLLSKKYIRYIVIPLVIILLAGGTLYTYKRVVAASAKKSSEESTAKAVRGDLSVTISGTGTVQPIAKYSIVPLVSGNILSAPFEEGDQVKAGDVLYKIDDSNLSFNIQKAQNGIEKLKLSSQSTVDSINNLEVTAPFEGRITNFSLSVGDQITANSTKIADLVDDMHFKVIVPFNEVQAQKISAGQKAQVLFSQFLTSVEGTVRFVNMSPKSSDGGTRLCDVEISFDNPGAVMEGMSASVVVKTGEGDIAGVNSGKVAYNKSQALTAQTGGKVKQILMANGERVKAGQRLLVLENDSLATTRSQNLLELSDSQLSLESQIKQLNDYNILSPIDGVVISKSYKAGDTLYGGSSSTTLMTVADLSKMKFTIAVDELDVAKVALEQKVEITCDALSDTSFEGKVTGVAMEGTTSNGVTTYSVTVTVDNPGKLRPNMNVKAKIQVENKKSVVYVPLSAVTKINGKSIVTVKAAGTGSTQAAKNNAGATGATNQPSMPNSTGQTGNRGNGQPPSGGMADNSGKKGAAGDKQVREVTVGINTDSYIEIVSGLEEGETVYLPVTSGSSTTTRTNNTGGGMGMGMPGGGGGPRPN